MPCRARESLVDTGRSARRCQRHCRYRHCRSRCQRRRRPTHRCWRPRRRRCQWSPRRQPWPRSQRQTRPSPRRVREMGVSVTKQSPIGTRCATKMGVLARKRSAGAIRAMRVPESRCRPARPSQVQRYMRVRSRKEAPPIWDNRRGSRGILLRCVRWRRAYTSAGVNALTLIALTGVSAMMRRLGSAIPLFFAATVLGSLP